MKRIIFLLSIMFCSVAFAHTIEWYVGDNLLSTTTCESGDNITPPTVPTKFGYHLKEWVPYKARIEYLESTGTQWIDTGVVPDYKTKFRVKLNMSQYTGDLIIGYAIDSNNLYRLFNYSGTIYFDYGNDTGGRISGGSFANNKTYDFLVGNRYVANYETNRIIIGRQQDDTSFYGTKTIRIFQSVIAKGKIYLLQIWQDDILVRDFIPVLDKDDIPCMYDNVEHKFYYNAGTSQFIAGPVLNE